MTACYPMSEERISELEQKLNVLDRLVRIGWAFLCGAFALGVWAATLEIRMQTSDDTMVRHEAEIKTARSDMHRIEVGETQMKTDIAYIKVALDRIEKKLP